MIYWHPDPDANDEPQIDPREGYEDVDRDYYDIPEDCEDPFEEDTHDYDEGEMN